MKAKEKALKLCQKFGMLGMGWEQTEFTTLDLKNAKECALIVANEMLDSYEPHDARDYWTEVKKEIEAL